MKVGFVSRLFNHAIPIDLEQAVEAVSNDFPLAKHVEAILERIRYPAIGAESNPRLSLMHAPKLLDSHRLVLAQALGSLRIGQQAFVDQIAEVIVVAEDDVATNVPDESVRICD